MLYINSNNSVYSGDMIDGDRELTEEESAIYLRGYGYDFTEDHKIIDISKNPEYLAKEVQKTIIELVEDNYSLKANVAYVGIFCHHNNYKLIFQTNTASTNNISSTDREFRSDDTITTVNWKFWTADQPINFPYSVAVTREEFYKLDKFARNVGKQAFDIETTYNNFIITADRAKFLDKTFVEGLKNQMKASYATISTDTEMILSGGIVTLEEEKTEGS